MESVSGTNCCADPGSQSSTIAAAYPVAVAKTDAVAVAKTDAVAGAGADDVPIPEASSYANGGTMESVTGTNRCADPSSQSSTIAAAYPVAVAGADPGSQSSTIAAAYPVAVAGAEPGSDPAADDPRSRFGAGALVVIDGDRNHGYRGRRAWQHALESPRQHALRRGRRKQYECDECGRLARRGSRRDSLGPALRRRRRRIRSIDRVGELAQLGPAAQPERNVSGGDAVPCTRQFRVGRGAPGEPRRRRQLRRVPRRVHVGPVRGRESRPRGHIERHSLRPDHVIFGRGFEPASSTSPQRHRRRGRSVADRRARHRWRHRRPPKAARRQPDLRVRLHGERQFHVPRQHDDRSRVRRAAGRRGGHVPGHGGRVRFVELELPSVARAVRDRARRGGHDDVRMRRRHGRRRSAPRLLDEGGEDGRGERLLQEPDGTAGSQPRGCHDLRAARAVASLRRRARVRFAIGRARRAAPARMPKL